MKLPSPIRIWLSKQPSAILATLEIEDLYEQRKPLSWWPEVLREMNEMGYQISDGPFLTFDRGRTKMRSRAEVVKFFREKLDKVSEKKYNDPSMGQWHFGMIELRALMDFIYDGEPQCEEEELKW